MAIPDDGATYKLMSLRLGGCRALCQHTGCVMHVQPADGESFVPGLAFKLADDGALGDVMCTSFASSEPKPVFMQQAAAALNAETSPVPAQQVTEPQAPSEPSEQPAASDPTPPSEPVQQPAATGDASPEQAMTPRERRAAERAKAEAGAKARELDLGDE